MPALVRLVACPAVQAAGACCVDQLFREKSSAAEKFLRSIEFAGLIGPNISGLAEI